MALRFVLPLALIAFIPAIASADDDDMPPPPPPTAQVPVYTAPLSQTTQTTYVPQSVALSGPDEISDVEEGRQAPMGYTTVYRTRKGALIGGGVTFGVSYGICLLTAAIGEDTRDVNYDTGVREANPVGAMWIPVAGPFVQMANTDSATARLFLAGLGAAQVTGAVLLYYGMTSKKRVFVRNDLVGNITVTPLAGNGVSGLGLSGSF